jgi:hypothetical protein
LIKAEPSCTKLAVFVTSERKKENKRSPRYMQAFCCKGASVAVDPDVANMFGVSLRERECRKELRSWHFPLFVLPIVISFVPRCLCGEESCP